MTDVIERLYTPDRRARQLGWAMARAFRYEPNVTSMLRDETRRERALAWFFGSFVVRLGLRYGEVYTTPAGAGGAVWMRPGAHTSLWATLRAGLLAMLLHFGPSGAFRSAAFGAYVEQIRKTVAPPLHWYLVDLGVDPAAQGRGLGGALLQPVLARADADAMPCYLETFRERTVTFYKRFGFTVVHTDTIPKGGPPFWCMAITPAAPDPVLQVT
ncbi:MAG TPA: GNAT family N-acetyltransferase [Roseiflexaceae bacterium]|nr:GNAT family N-acetyltransferase [Roseiflexaceae bacterium]